MSNIINKSRSKHKKSESGRRTIVAGLGAGFMSLAFFGRKLKNSDTENNKERINIEEKINIIEKVNIEIHPSAIKRNEG